MNRAGEKLLAGARIAVDEHACVGIGDEACLPEKVFHLRTARDDARAPFARCFAAVHRRIACEAQCRSDKLQQLLAVERLREKAENAALRRRNGIRNRAVRGQDDHGKRRMLPMNGLEKLQAVDPGHSQIGDHRGRTHDGETG